MFMQISKNFFFTKLKWAGLSAICGFFAGLSATVFLILLQIVTEFRQNHPLIIWLLPIAGLLIGMLFHHVGKDISKGNNLILEEIHDPKKIIPFAMAPLILLGTVVTHLFGGSAGREGTAVQMGASLSDQLSLLFSISKQERRTLLVAGAGAGFGAAIGTPWAGVLFGLEIIQVGRFKFFSIMECIIASFIGYYTTVLFKAPHTHYPKIVIPNYDLKLLLYISIAGVIFGLTARSFSFITHTFEKLFSKISYAPFKPFFGGILLVIFFYFEGTYRFTGLGIESIQNALLEKTNFDLPALKIFFTSLTIGTGFKGGEFIPLVFIGTTLGSALSIILPVSFSLLGALGMAAVFGGAANTPLTSTVMAMEIFGASIGPYALLACYMSYYFSGHKGIYKSQKYYQDKHKLLYSRLLFLGEIPKRLLKK
jgi:H+/Cl- antiporter ClcA